MKLGKRAKVYVTAHKQSLLVPNAFVSHLHGGEAHVPALDDLLLPDHELERLASVPRAVELAPALKCSFVGRSSGWGWGIGWTRIQLAADAIMLVCAPKSGGLVL